MEIAINTNLLNLVVIGQRQDQTELDKARVKIIKFLLPIMQLFSYYFYYFTQHQPKQE